MDLGVCTSTGRIYAGSIHDGMLLDPSPFISPCKIAVNQDELRQGPDAKNPFGHMFREDFYDPKSRIRRGRLYSNVGGGVQPQSWRQSHGSALGRFNTYFRGSIWHQFYRGNKRSLYLLLGDEERYTRWKVIDVELLASGEELITLKSHSVFGSIPVLLECEIPQADLSLINKKLDHLLDDLHSAGAESVVDDCREALSAILGSFLDSGDKDLGALVNELGKLQPPLNLARDMADAVKILHPRRKSNEQRARGLRQITDEDAQLAVIALPTVLVEIGWGRW